ncbi:MAG: 16S rRNA (uracil(1498)-N(3))-methyltransferase [Verrucomicrobia bacterium]|nr:16S rRNA (uracil(1498)-N(3))-methyltransferase [Verrucomicrobiota bacterium]
MSSSPLPANRFFTPHPLEQGEVLLEGDEAHHLQKAMRGALGDMVELINGRGELAQGKILAFPKKGVLLEILSSSSEPKPLATILLQAIPRQGRLSTIIEKGTELGATDFWLFSASRGERESLSPQGLERCSAVAVAAMKQCGSLYLPTICLKKSLFKLTFLPEFSFYGSIDANAPPFSPPPGQEILFAIGPESGFTPEEEKHLESLGALECKLHTHILRTDTAPLAALSLIARARL